MLEITSASNNRIKQVIQWQKSAKDREKDNVFLVEGAKMYKEAPKSWIKEVYLTSKMYEELKDIICDASYECILIPDSLMVKISDTKTPQGILTVLTRPNVSCDFDDVDPPLYIVLENLQDPGNMGTIIRMAEAAGVTRVLVSKDSVDIYNPKVVRSTMGSIFRVRVTICENICETVRNLRDRGINVYAAHLKGSEIYTDHDYKEATAFLIGNEGNGLTDEITELANKRLFIPMEGSVESLNAGIAATILADEAHRQRS